MLSPFKLSSTFLELEIHRFSQCLMHIWVLDGLELGGGGGGVGVPMSRVDFEKQ